LVPVLFSQRRVGQLAPATPGFPIPVETDLIVSLRQICPN
jgi:hypothetical protein